MTDPCELHSAESQRLQRTPDIVTRLRQTRANMIGTDDEQHYWDCHDAAGEIERLRRRTTLGGAEREAIAYFAEFFASPRERDARHAATLRGLLERTR